MKKIIILATGMLILATNLAIAQSNVDSSSIRPMSSPGVSLPSNALMQVSVLHWILGEINGTAFQPPACPGNGAFLNESFIEFGNTGNGSMAYSCVQAYYPSNTTLNAAYAAASTSWQGCPGTLQDSLGGIIASIVLNNYLASSGISPYSSVLCNPNILYSEYVTSEFHTLPISNFAVSTCYSRGSAGTNCEAGARITLSPTNSTPTPTVLSCSISGYAMNGYYSNNLSKGGSAGNGIPFQCNSNGSSFEYQYNCGYQSSNCDNEGTNTFTASLVPGTYNYNIQSFRSGGWGPSASGSISISPNDLGKTCTFNMTCTPYNTGVAPNSCSATMTCN